MSVPYQLGCLQGQAQTHFVFFDNASDDPEDRLCVIGTIRRLQGEENDAVARAIVEWHGKPRREGGALEYMKYIFVLNGRREVVHVFDIDALCSVEPPPTLGLRKAVQRLAMVPCEVNALEECAKKPLKKGMTWHVGAGPSATRTIRLSTKKHGNVTLKLSTYDDPDIRNEVSLSVQKNLRRDSCWGAYVRSADPKLLRVKHPNALPALKSAKEIEQFNSNDYWEVIEGRIDRNGVPRETKQMVKRGTFKHYGMKLSELQ